ncbi:HD domain-containing protein 2 [Coelomomyces lativittatus]|nr:HD domain-containing protein 2 [Coelomomyces lativittatus]
MYRLSMMCMQLKDPSLNRLKCMQLALVHDVAESIVGDITPHCGISKEQKFELEKNAFHTLDSYLPKETSLLSVWTDYESQRSPEAKVVHQLDRFEMLFQAFEYEQRSSLTNSPLDLSSFFESVDPHEFQHPEVHEWYTHLIHQRNTYFKEKNQ